VVLHTVIDLSRVRLPYFIVRAVLSRWQNDRAQTRIVADRVGKVAEEWFADGIPADEDFARAIVLAHDGRVAEIADEKEICDRGVSAVLGTPHPISATH
jgi:hypothetical protein